MNGRHLSALAVALFAPAWLLTAAHTSGELVGGRSAGWQAFVFAISPLVGNDVGGSLAWRVWMVSSALSNAAFLGSSILLWWRPQRVSHGLVASMAAATLINAFWFFLPDMRGDLRVGYYLWLTAFALVTFAALATVRGRSVTARVGAGAA